MSSLKCKKSYDLIVDNKHFPVYISEHDGGQFCARCDWYEGERILRAPGQTGGLRLESETRLGNSEKDALKQLLVWVKTQFGKEGKLKESK